MKNLLDIPRTAMEVFNMLPEGTLCEVMDNTIYMSPAPTPNHQDVLGEIYFQLKALLRTKPLGKAFVAPLDVYLDTEQSVVEPDILFIKNESLNIIQQKGIYGAPDLVIEILSSNKDYDLQQKFNLYQRNGVPEYIIVDPVTKQVWHYLLQSAIYQQIHKELPHGRLYIEQLQLEVSF